MEKISIDKWVDLAIEQPIPILRHTIKELRILCGQENIPVKEITHVVERDPGLVIHILRTANNLSKGRLSAEITNVNQAFRLMGTNQITHLPDVLPAIGDVLNDKSKVRLLATFDRAYHAARFATDAAALDRDMTPDEVFAAALLHFLGEMIIAIHAPELLDEIATYRHDDHISSEDAQYMVLGFSFNELTLKISEKLKFPELVTQTLLSENAKFHRAYGVMLGVQLARNVACKGWYSEHTLNIQKEFAEWMGVSVDAVIARSHVIAAQIAREIPQYDTPPAARLLPLILKKPETKTTTINKENEAVCLIPQLSILRDAVKMMITFSAENVTSDEFIKQTVKFMHDGVGLNRVAFYLYVKDKNELQTHTLKGTDNDPVFNHYAIKLDGSNIFSVLIDKNKAVSINETNHEKFWPLVPAGFKKVIATTSFVAMPVFIKNKPYGVFYADRYSSSCQIEEKSYNFFKTLCLHSTKVLNTLL
jgi:hypothetical protein